jgi:hypothetical protein
MQQIRPEHEDLVRARAYQFWLDEGRPHGRHEIHWQKAVASVSAEVIPDVTPVAVEAAPAVAAAKAKAPRAKAAKAPAKKR